MLKLLILGWIEGEEAATAAGLDRRGCLAVSQALPECNSKKPYLAIPRDTKRARMSERVLRHVATADVTNFFVAMHRQEPNRFP